MWLLWTILIGILAGFLAGKIVKGYGHGHVDGPGRRNRRLRFWAAGFSRYSGSPRTD